MAITKTTPSKKTSTPRRQEPTNLDCVLDLGREAPKGSAELRQSMIRDTAYFLAERRGFAAGDPSQDWLDAEAEIDRLLEQNPTSRT